MIESDVVVPLIGDDALCVIIMGVLDLLDDIVDCRKSGGRTR